MNYLVITSAAVILILLMLAQIMFSLRQKRRHILEQWNKIGHLWQEYLDRIPYLLEIWPSHEVKQTVVNELIETHGSFFIKKLRPKTLEEHLSECEKNIAKVVDQFEETSKMASKVHWLVIRKELHDLAKALRTAAQKYDLEASRFNRLLKIMFFCRLMGIGKISSF